MRIGEWLMTHAIIDAPSLEGALAIQHQSGGRLGDILLSRRSITPLQWLAALKAQGHPTLSADALWNADSSLLDAGRLDDYVRYSYVPIRIDTTLYIATPSPNRSLKTHCEQVYGPHYTLAIVTKRDFHGYLLYRLGDPIHHNARERLHETTPDYSAKHPLTAGQKCSFLALALFIPAAACLYPMTTWYCAIIFTTLFYLLTLGFKLTLLLLSKAAANNPRYAEWRHTASVIEASALPIYSILVPLYRESPQVLTQIVASLEALDYPKDKLDIWLITEADDTDTYTHLQQIKPADYCRILRVPPSLPRTKPKACNVALPLLKGEYVTIYDAEDRPDPGQLKLSVAAFSHLGEQVACLQAPLNYFNRKENMLTRFFAIEYSALFTMFLPCLERLNFPIPLGGTSNHIRLQTLRAVGGWDPYNVTEDADLGIRLSYHRYRTDILPSLTLEESPITLSAWLKQRSRWIKGYIQTWLVYMRRPAAASRRLGFFAYLGFHLFVGAPAITFLLAPLFWAISILSLTGAVSALHLPPWLLSCCIVTLVLGIALQWATAYMAVRNEDWPRMHLAIFLYPAYWLLHPLASVKALWQLAFKPHYWEKTSHGLSKLFQKRESNG